MTRKEIYEIAWKAYTDSARKTHGEIVEGIIDALESAGVLEIEEEAAK